MQTQTNDKGKAIIGVSELSAMVRRALTTPDFRRLRVRGEVSEFSERNDTRFFTLKEGRDQIRCVLWPDYALLAPIFEKGSEVVVSGDLGVFESFNQIYVTSVELGGVGQEFERIRQLRKKLTEEGLFEESRKRGLPKYPFVIALVSSPQADGYLDFVNGVVTKAPYIEILPFYTRLQGAEAPAQIASAVQRASLSDADLIAIVRGGGTEEDLIPFSDERVVRAVFEASLPVITAIGHLRHQTLADLAADVSESAPAEAANRVVFEARQAKTHLREAGSRLERSLSRKIAGLSQRFTYVTGSAVIVDHPRVTSKARQHLINARGDLDINFASGVTRKQETVLRLERRLTRQDPLQRISKGWSDLQKLRMNLLEIISVLSHDNERRLQSARAALAARSPEAGFKDIEKRVRDRGGRLDAAVSRAVGRSSLYLRELESILPRVEQSSVRRNALRLQHATALLKSSSLERSLKRGFAIIRKGGTVVQHLKQINPGDAISAQMYEGMIGANVTEVSRK